MLNQEVEVSKAILSNLHNPVFSDVTIVATDGEIQANKVILSMRSQYFLSMFSSNNNFVECQENSVKMPYSKAVLEKVVIYLYSGQMKYEDMALRPLLDLLELLNLMNLSSEFSSVEGYVLKNIRKGEYATADCLKCLDVSSKLGLVSVGEKLLSYLGKNFVKFSQSEEVGLLSQEMIIRLLEEKREEASQTVFRFRTFVTWLSLNPMDTDIKDGVLQTLKFEDFTFKELSSDVRKSGLYSTDQIMVRMEELFQGQSKELANKSKELKEGKETLYREVKVSANLKLELVGTKLELDEKKLELEEGKRAYKAKVNEVEQLKKEKVDRCFVPEETRIKYDPDYNYKLSYVTPSRR